MSASKKTKSKPAKSPAPATKSAAPAKPAVKTKAIAPAPVKAVAPAKSAAPVVKPKPAPLTIKSVASKPVLTTISARLDVGFGNALYVRGEGAGLSWDNGLLMECVEAELWRIVLPESAHGHTFKFLVNDLSWSTGPDFTVPSGAHVTLTPEF